MSYASSNWTTTFLETSLNIGGLSHPGIFNAEWNNHGLRLLTRQWHQADRRATRIYSPALEALALWFPIGREKKPLVKFFFKPGRPLFDHLSTCNPCGYMAGQHGNAFSFSIMTKIGLNLELGFTKFPNNAIIASPWMQPQGILNALSYLNWAEIKEGSLIQI